MPYGGRGYLEQPRWWRGLMRFLNSRYAPIYAAYLRKESDGDNKEPEDITEWIEDDTEVGQAVSFERLNG